MNKQEEILFLIKTHGVKLQWLADQMEIPLKTLNFLLNDSEKFDDDLYSSIKETVESYQYELDLFENIETDDNLDLFNEDELKKGIGERIRIFAKRRFSTLKALADAMEISPQQLQQYISGHREPGSKILIKLLKLGCNINWLLGGSESIESYKIYKLESDLKKAQYTLNKISQLADRTIHPHHPSD